jgi:hypothetical protein
VSSMNEGLVRWAPIPGADHTDVDKVVAVVATHFSLESGVPLSIRRVRLSAGVGSSLDISISIKTVMPLVQMLLDIVQTDINNGGELVRKS